MRSRHSERRRRRLSDLGTALDLRCD